MGTTPSTKSTPTRRLRPSLTAIAVAGSLALVGGHAAIAADTASAAAEPVTAPLAAEPPVLSDAEYTAAMAALQETHPQAFGDSPPAAKVAAAAPAAVAAKLFGKKVFEGGVTIGLFQVATQLGINPFQSDNEVILETLGQIQQSLDGLKVEVGEIKELVQQILEGQQLSNFLTSELAAAGYQSDIQSMSHVVAGQYASGDAPSEADVLLVGQSSLTAVTGLASALTHPTVGTIGLLQTALASQDSDEAWTQVEDYRDNYRAVMAQGLVNLHWAGQWDEEYGNNFGTWYFDGALAEAEAALESMYDAVGVEHPQIPADHPSRDHGPLYLHVNGEDWALADGDRPLIDDEERLEVLDESEALTAALSDLRADFLARPNHGVTFEQHLQRKGMLTEYRLTDRFAWSNVPQPGLYLTELHVRGDDFVDDRQMVHEGFPSGGVPEADRLVAKLRAEITAGAPYTLAVDTNSHGYAIFDDENAIQMAKTGIPDFQAERLDDKPGPVYGDGNYSVEFVNPGGAFPVWDVGDLGGPTLSGGARSTGGEAGSTFDAVDFAWSQDEFVEIRLGLEYTDAQGKTQVAPLGSETLQVDPMKYQELRPVTIGASP